MNVFSSASHARVKKILNIVVLCLGFTIPILLDFLVTVKAAPHECVIRTGQP